MYVSDWLHYTQFDDMMYRHLELVTLLLFVILLLDGGKLVDARSWRDIVIGKDVDNNSINSEGGQQRRRHHVRPGELEFEIEEDPFLFPSSAIISTTKERIKEEEQEVTSSTAAPTVDDQYPFYENSSTDTVTASTTVSVSDQPVIHNIFVHPSSSDGTISDSIIDNKKSRSNGRSPLATFVEPTDLPTSSISPTTTPTEFPSTGSPTRAPTRAPTRLPSKSPTETPTGIPTTNTNMIASYVYPENSVTPLRYYSRPFPRGYFNYDSSTQSLFGPGYPVIAYNSQDELVVQYTNNRWVDNFRPPSLLPSSTALAITNNNGENNDDDDDGSSNPYSYYYWDEFGPEGYGFGPWKDTLTKRNMRGVNSNQCGNVGNQSPIDIRLSGVACIEHHQIRTRVSKKLWSVEINATNSVFHYIFLYVIDINHSVFLPRASLLYVPISPFSSNNKKAGDFRIGGDNNNVILKILPSKLRIWVQRRPCRDIENPVCSEPDPPHADFPNGCEFIK